MGQTQCPPKPQLVPPVAVRRHDAAVPAWAPRQMLSYGAEWKDPSASWAVLGAPWPWSCWSPSSL